MRICLVLGNILRGATFSVGVGTSVVFHRSGDKKRAELV
jgi:hypothetical protein